MEIKVWTRIPHKGWVNLAIVDPKTLMLIGEPLASFETDFGEWIFREDGTRRDGGYGI